MKAFSAQLEAVTDTPALVIDIAIVRRNIERMAQFGKRHATSIRPHIKTHKMIPIAKMQIDAGAVGVTAAKLGEAEVMVDGGIEDVLIAYPIVGAQKIDRMLQLADRARVSLAVDSLEVVRGIGEAAQARSMEIPILVEVDTGLKRLGVTPTPGARQLAQQIADLKGVRFAGLMTHEGHAYMAGGPDGLRQATERAALAMAEAASEIEAVGLEVLTVSMGSSATAPFGIGKDRITEFRPGTYVFNDRTQVAHGAAGPEDCAAAVVVTVISTRHGEVVVDAGTKALAADLMVIPDAPRTFGAVAGYPDWEVVRVSEEHAVIRVPVDESLTVGDRLALIPNHVCPVVNLSDSVIVFDGERFIGNWPVDARGRLR